MFKMNVWEFRQLIEQSIPLWAIFVPVAIGLVGVLYLVYGKK